MGNIKNLNELCIFRISIIRFFWCIYFIKTFVFWSFDYYWAASLLTYRSLPRTFFFTYLIIFHCVDSSVQILRPEYVIKRITRPLKDLDQASASELLWQNFLTLLRKPLKTYPTNLVLNVNNEVVKFSGNNRFSKIDNKASFADENCLPMQSNIEKKNNWF